MMKHFVVTILIMFVSIVCFCQGDRKATVLGNVEKLPIRNAQILKFGYKPFEDYIPAVSITSKIDSVFSICDGIVSAIFYFSDSNATIIIRDTKDNFYTYTQLKSSLVEKGDSVIKSKLLGYAKQEDQSENTYNAILMVTEKDNRDLSEDKIWSLIKEE